MIPDSLTGLPPEAYYAIAGVAIGMVGFIGGHQYASNREESRDLQTIEELEGAEGFEMTSYGNGRKKGAISTIMRERKKRKALEKGVVRWHLVGAGFEKPKYIKPERKEGGNLPEVEYKDDTYYFPTEATVPSEEEGVPVMIHRKGESDPIDLRSDWDLAVDAGTLSQYLTLRVTSSPSAKGLLDGFGLGDYDAMTLFRYGIFGIIALALLWEVAG